MKIVVLPRFLVLIVSVFILQHISAQEVKILEGKIFTDSISAEGIHVVNLTLKQGSSSSADGLFQIKARIRDTIIFSSVQFFREEIIITETLFNSGILEIKLTPATTELDEVRLNNLGLTGVLSADSEKIDVFNQTDAGIPLPRKRKTQLERQLYTATSSSAGIPLDLIINTINGRIKNIKRAMKKDKEHRTVHQTLEDFGTEFIAEEYRIPDEEVINFIYFAYRDQEFSNLLSLNDDLGLIQFLHQKRDEFIEWRELKLAEE